MAFIFLTLCERIDSNLKAVLYFHVLFSSCWENAWLRFIDSVKAEECMLRLFICFCRSHCERKCEQQKLNSSWKINCQSHLSHKFHHKNYTNVCCKVFKTLDSFKVLFLNISWSFVAHIVTHNVRNNCRWISLMFAVGLTTFELKE